MSASWSTLTVTQGAPLQSAKKRPQTSGVLELVHTAHWFMGATWVPHFASLCSVTSLGGLKSAVADVLAPQKAANAPDQEHFPLEPQLLSVF